MKWLLIFWLLAWIFFLGWGRPLSHPFEKPPPVLGPLTIQEKILLGYRLDINCLTKEELEVLPKIGPSTAEKIIAFRKQKGPLAGLNALVQIRGIGEKTVESLKPYLSNF